MTICTIQNVAYIEEHISSVVRNQPFICLLYIAHLKGDMVIIMETVSSAHHVNAWYTLYIHWYTTLWTCTHTVESSQCMQIYKQLLWKSIFEAMIFGALNSQTARKKISQHPFFHNFSALIELIHFFCSCLMAKPLIHSVTLWQKWKYEWFWQKIFHPAQKIISKVWENRC